MSVAMPTPPSSEVPAMALMMPFLTFISSLLRWGRGAPVDEEEGEGRL
jgi:hypothetical protein